jgi:hypothetical protein
MMTWQKNKSNLTSKLQSCNIDDEWNLRSLRYDIELRIFYLNHLDYDDRAYSNCDDDYDLGFTGSYCEHEG